VANVLIVYHSRTGNTKKMAEAVAEGAGAVVRAEVTVKPVDQCAVDDLLAADAIIMGTPVYYGTMAAELKKLIDDSVTHHGDLVGKVGGAFATCGTTGGGAETAVLDILKAWLIHGMIIQGEALGSHYGPVCVGAPDQHAREECLKLGKAVATLALKLAHA
jgi:NAD(P)H dehydrogenase (quinone)